MFCVQLNDRFSATKNLFSKLRISWYLRYPQQLQLKTAVIGYSTFWVHQVDETRKISFFEQSPEINLKLCFI